MRRVFLSYASQDQGKAELLVRWLRDRGMEPFWWQDAQQRGNVFVDELERGIARADLFLALLSPHYLTSPWCRHERVLAMQREIDLRRRFLYAIEVTPTSYPEAGFLRNYDWLDAKDPLDDPKLEAIATALKLAAAAQPPAPVEEVPGPTPVFRNREDEVSTLVNALTVTGGRELWVVVSPPRMGKSWLLDRVQRELGSVQPGWSVRLLDLREQPVGLRTDPVQLLRTLLDIEHEALDLPADGPLGPRELRDIAAIVIRRNRPQLYLLDSADLLDPMSAAHVRAALTDVYQMVRESGSRRAKVAVLVGTRRHDDWRGLGSGASAGVRFAHLSLTQFRTDVVLQALDELDRDLGAHRRWECAHRLHRLSGGLPALLVRSVQWAVRTQFLAMHESDGDAAFDEVARTYIQDDLLAVESLLPLGDPRQHAAMAAIDRALRVLATYRLFTQSHLRFHLTADPGFGAALTAAGWTPPDLWEALGRTSLCRPASNELWQEFEPAIRRLLHRYYYRTDEERVAAQVVARDFYERWTAVRTAGKEQPVVLVECLWHEAARMVIDDPEAVPLRLPVIASELARQFAGSPIYEPQEFSSFVASQLRNDEEFQVLLQRYGGLFEEIIKSVVLAVPGDLG